jgi:replicative DNA helicase
MLRAETGSQYSEDEILKSYADYVPSNKPSVDYKTRLSSQNGLHKAAEKFKAKVNELSISSGFPQWDEVLQGRGFKPASTYCIQGLSGTGKSIFTCNVARRIFMDGKNVLFISTEMDDAEITDRIIRAETSKSEHKFDEAVVEFDNLLGSGNHGEIELVKVHPGTTTVYDIEKEIQKLDFKPDILIIDYADQIAITDKGVSEYDKHGIVYDHLKRIAGEYYIPILTATQTNRSAADENGGTKSYIGMTTVSDSMKKLHALDSMFGIVQTVQDKDEGKISLSIVKNRGGMGHGMVDFSINYNYMRLGNIFIKNTTPKRSKEKEEKDETTYKHINSPVEIRYFNTIIQENMSPIDGAKYLKEKMRHKEIDKDEYDAIMLEVRSYRRRRDEAKNN